MPGGWIKLYRQSVDNPIYTEKPFDDWHAWTDLLLLVNHERREFYSKGETVILEPGQTITTVRILAGRWGWSKNRVHRFLKDLSLRGMCEIETTKRGTTLTVTNWDKFQASSWDKNEDTNRDSNEDTNRDKNGDSSSRINTGKTGKGRDKNEDTNRDKNRDTNWDKNGPLTRSKEERSKEERRGWPPAGPSSDRFAWIDEWARNYKDD